MHTFEVEIKVLLGTKKEAQRVVDLLKKSDLHVRMKAQSKQLNHYFAADGDFDLLKQRIIPYISKKELRALDEVLTVSSRHSVRTRDADGKIILVVKADRDSVADSMHGNMRYEWEAQIRPISNFKFQISNAKNKSQNVRRSSRLQPTTNPPSLKASARQSNPQRIEDLDSLILSCGFSYLSKWSRARKEYIYKDMTVCIDKNAGYGYLAEFEIVVHSENEADAAKETIKNELKALGLEELSQKRLGRMFAHYNAHWKDYYRTEKVFVIE